MFFEDHEKAIYSPACLPGRKYDPLVVDRTLTVVTSNSLSALLRDRNAVCDDLGDVSEEARSANEVLSVRAEERLAEAARVAFALPPFPEDAAPGVPSTDGLALECLYDFLEWMAKKGRPGVTRPDSSTSDAA